LELVNRIAQPVPKPRTHRHRYYGVLAPNSRLRGAVTAMAQAAQAAQVVTPAVRNFVADAACTDAGSAGGVPGVAGVGAAAQPEPPVKPKKTPTIALSVGRTDRAYLRGLSAAVPCVRGPDAHHPRNRSWTRPSGLRWGALARLSAAAPSVPAHAWTARRRQASGLTAACKADDAAGCCPQGEATPLACASAAQSSA